MNQDLGKHVVCLYKLVNVDRVLSLTPLMTPLLAEKSMMTNRILIKCGAHLE